MGQFSFHKNHKERQLAELRCYNQRPVMFGQVFGLSFSCSTIIVIRVYWARYRRYCLGDFARLWPMLFMIPPLLGSAAVVIALLVNVLNIIITIVQM